MSPKRAEKKRYRDIPSELHTLASPQELYQQFIASPRDPALHFAKRAKGGGNGKGEGMFARARLVAFSCGSSALALVSALSDLFWSWPHETPYSVWVVGSRVLGDVVVGHRSGGWSFSRPASVYRGE